MAMAGMRWHLAGRGCGGVVAGVAAAFMRLMTRNFPMGRTAVRVAWLLVSLAAMVSCAAPGAGKPKADSRAVEAPAGGLAGSLTSWSAARGGQSGIAVLEGNREAFADRVMLADRAQRTLDIQYYIWSPDTIGLLLTERVFRAAERGVRVRFLIDDLNLKIRDGTMGVLASHPNVEIRLFNPQRLRSFRRLDLLLNFARLNYRMHNKMMIMDNAAAVIGGRNIADEYFGLHGGHNMRDLDLLATGPVVREASRVFDDFWNSAAAVPVENVAKVSATPAAMRRAAGELRRGFRPKEDDWPLRVDEAAVGARVASLPRVLVPAQAELLHDDIGSFRGKDRGHMLVSRLENELRTAEQSLDVEAAYFVLRRRDVAAGEVMLKRNVKVRVVTNSLASTNQPAAHSGHANRRREFLRTGAGLYEFRPRSEAGLRQVADGRDGARTGIHTKAMVIDGRKSFVGSFNLDPRSANINTEVGLLVESGEVSRQVGEFLKEATAPENAWRVTLDERGREVWRGWDGGEERFWRHEPQTSLSERIRCRFFRLLPIESLL